MTKSKPRAVEEMTDDELMEAWTSTGEEAAALRERLKEFSAEHQRRTIQAQLAARLGALSEPERAALAQYVEAQGIESQENVGSDA